VKDKVKSSPLNENFFNCTGSNVKLVPSVVQTTFKD
jgi:hypothetical protein